MAVQRLIGGSKFEDDLCGCLTVRVREYCREEFINSAAINGNFLVATVPNGTCRTVFKSVECAFAGQCLALVPISNTILSGRIIFADQYGQQRIIA